MKALWILGTVAIVAVVVWVSLVTVPGRPKSPEQPIGFSHKIHAGDNQIPCLYCHVNARRSIVAGIPSVQRCIGCHESIPGDRPGIQRLQAYWNRKEPIPWIKVYDQPDFVHFSHKRHILKGIACERCHGSVEAMDVVREAVTLDMDRCVACHMEREANIDCWGCHK
ncbi:MAG: cytochrome c3 family protein [Candidatus Methylomirabilales bacterium]